MYCAGPQVGTATYNLLRSFYRCVIRNRPKYGQRHSDEGNDMEILVQYGGGGYDGRENVASSRDAEP